MEGSLEEKQQFLRTEILESGIDPQSFMAFMGTVKNEGQSIDIENWTIQELKRTVKEFKDSREEEIKREKKEIIESRGSKEMMTSRIMESIKKKEKVFYDKDDLWDFEIHTEQQCKKIKTFFDFQCDPQIDHKGWQVKKSGGFIFGIGAKNELQLKLITNFTGQIVTRKSEDVDWLRETLVSKYAGSYIPPLEETRYFEPEDKGAIIRRIRQIISFLNSLVNFDHLIQNKYFHSFIAERDQKAFYAFKSKQTAARVAVDIGSIQTLQGKFSVQISKRVLNFIKDSSEFGRQTDEIHLNLETNFKKILADIETLSKHSHYVANDFAKFHEKYNKVSQKCKLYESNTGPNLSNVLLYLNHMFTTMGNQYKKQIILIKQIAQEFVRYSHAQWSQFLLHEKRYNVQLNNYLSFKFNLQRKKERCLNDVSKWELDEKEQFRMSRVNVSKMEREEAFEVMFPKDNQVEEEMRIWQAYINDMYERSFKILVNEQEKTYIKNFGKFCVNMQKLTKEQNEMYKKFDQTFGSQSKQK